MQLFKHVPARALCSCAGVALCAVSPRALAVDYSWAAGVSGNWNIGGNWAPNGFPTGAGTTATIGVAPVSTPYTVTLSNGVSSLAGFTLNQTDATLLVGGGGQLGMAGPLNLLAGTLSVNGGSLAGTGAFTLAPGATLRTFSNVTMPASMTYSLGGSIIAEGTLQGFPASGVANNGSITMTGSGLAWLFAPPLTNNGVITVDGVGGGTGRLQSSITTTTTGAITMNADTEWRGSPHINSGAVTLASGKTLTVGSFAGVHQNAGTMTINGSYGHVNGSFNMNGGALQIGAGGAFLKDGGSFNYNGGSITGSPTLRNAALTLNPLATSNATFVLRGGNTLSGEVGANKAIRIEASATEPGGLSSGFGNLVNHGVITLAPTETQLATLSSFSGGLMNHGDVFVEPQPTDGNPTFAQAAAVLMFMFNLEGGRMEVDGGARVFLEALVATHLNRGLVLTDTGVYLGEVIVKAGSQSTFRQEAGTIQNDGAFVCEATNTFEFWGGECTGNPIRIDGATLKVGPDAGAGAFDVTGPGNLIRADQMHNQLRIAVFPEGTRPGADADVTWEPLMPGWTPTLGGELELRPRGLDDVELALPAGLRLGDGSLLWVSSEDGGEAFLSAPLPYGIEVPLSANPGRIVLESNTTIDGNVDVKAGSMEMIYAFDDAGPGRAGLPVLVEIDGNYSQGAAATLLLQVHAPGVSDTVNVTGQASLGGILSVVGAPGYSPAWGDAFTPLTYGGRVEDYSSLDAPTLADPNLRWWREAGATEYRVGVRHVADTNHDGVVDFLDLNNVLSYFGEPAPAGSAAAIGDANTDGVVDFLDLNQVLGAFGTSAP